MKPLFGAALCLVLISASTLSVAQVNDPIRKNQTEGFGAGSLLDFTYTQSFDCVDQPKSDLDFDKKKAESDPDEQQIPICQAGIDPTINPPGAIGMASTTTDPLYVLIPMFSTDNDQNPERRHHMRAVRVPGTMWSTHSGTTLIQLFGALPEGFKAKPAVFTQCPEPGSRPGTCTMHASRVDLAPVLAALGYIEDPDVTVPPIWWQVGYQVRLRVLNQMCLFPRRTTAMSSTARYQSAIAAGQWWQPSNPVLVLEQQRHERHEHGTCALISRANADSTSVAALNDGNTAGTAGVVSLL